jgi:hypothetical protein
VKRREITRVYFNSCITDFIGYEDIASLPASLFSTSVKLFDFPHSISFHHFIFPKHLNDETRAINKYEFPFFISLNYMGAINIEFCFTIYPYIFYFFYRSEVGEIKEYAIHSGRYLFEKISKSVNSFKLLWVNLLTCLQKSRISEDFLTKTF